MRPHYDFTPGRPNPYAGRGGADVCRPRYLEICYLRGRPLAAYLRLATRAISPQERQTRQLQGLPVDFDGSGAALGIEIPDPGHLSLPELNRVLDELGQLPMEEEEFAPLAAAASS